jgi:hypothetical protein
MKNLFTQTWRSWLVLLAVIAAAAVYIWQTTNAMPPMVASGFDAAGNAQKMTTREAYRTGVMTTAVFMPLAIALLISVLSKVSPSLISIPNRQYWLQSERVGEMQSYLAHWGIAVAIALCVFMAGMHMLVLAANAQKPPMLSQGVWMMVLAFLLFTGAMIVLMIRHFKNIKVTNPSIGGHLQVKMPQKSRRY